MDARKLIPVLSLMAAVTAVYGQSDDANYAAAYTYVERQSLDDDADPTTEENMKVVRDYQYYDGLGRPELAVSGGRNTSGAYVYTMNAYDKLGRLSEGWLPVVGGVSPTAVNAAAFARSSSSLYGDDTAFSVVGYDGLGRVVCESTPGQAWRSAGKVKRCRYMTNTANSVKRYVVGSGSDALSQNGFYAPGSLDGEEYEDEDGHTVAVYKDFLGRTVLERRGRLSDTYYVYDGVGMLRHVLSPGYQDEADIGKYAYSYSYDARGRLVTKVLPGCEPVNYWYDKADRLAFMQDATLRGRGIYRFYLYDRFGRLAVEGLCKSCDLNAANAVCHYLPTGAGFGGTGYELAPGAVISGYEIEAVNYYDDHDFLRLYAGEFPLQADSMSQPSPCAAPTLLTGRMQRASDRTRMLRALYYDLRCRVTDIRDISLFGHLTCTHTEYTHTGKVKTESRREYRPVGGALKPMLASVVTNHYDAKTGLLLSTDVTLSPPGAASVTERVSSLRYDGLGRVSSDMRGGSAGAVSYAYDLHGWLTKVSGGGFSQELQYAGGSYGLYNGDISRMVWQTAEAGNLHSYTFTYDELDRLTEAEYGSSAARLIQPNGNYTERVSEYTPNGMAARHQKYGLKDDGTYGLVDDLRISYDGNRVKSVTEYADAVSLYGASDYSNSWGGGVTSDCEYNGVGALSSDGGKGIGRIDYDNRNHIRQIVSSGSMGGLRYVYSAEGGKLLAEFSLSQLPFIAFPDTACIVPRLSSPSAVVPDWGAGILPMRRYTFYNGNTVYDESGPRRYMFPGGYATFGDGGTVAFHYYTCDHQGNVRTVVDSDGAIEQVNHYYPFGGVMAGIGLQPDLQQYKYNGKELERRWGLDWYDYGARWYDPVLPSWTSMDPLCEEHYNISPYAYCGGNPVRRVDPDGRDWISAMYEGERFVYYDSRVHSEADISKYYYGGGKNTNIEYVGKSGRITYDDGINETLKYVLNPDGSFCDADGRTIKKEISIDGMLHVGSDVIKKDSEYSHNMYGTYLGKYNPEYDNEYKKYFYAIPPIDELDYVAYLHDKQYDGFGASGIPGALFNLDVRHADVSLSGRSLNVLFNAPVFSKKWWWALGTGTAFSTISLYKNMLKWK